MMMTTTWKRWLWWCNYVSRGTRLAIPQRRSGDTPAVRCRSRALPPWAGSFALFSSCRTTWEAGWTDKKYTQMSIVWVASVAEIICWHSGWDDTRMTSNVCHKTKVPLLTNAHGQCEKKGWRNFQPAWKAILNKALSEIKTTFRSHFILNPAQLSLAQFYRSVHDVRAKAANKRKHDWPGAGDDLRLWCLPATCWGWSRLGRAKTQLGGTAEMCIWRHPRWSAFVAMVM